MKDADVTKSKMLKKGKQNSYNLKFVPFVLVGQAFPQQLSMTILRPHQTGRSYQN